MIEKLRSQGGASLSFSLMLMLVCAVVGSVVLTAGTTAAGRASQRAESDQRYYSVTSAAELLINKINQQKVEIVRSKQFTVTENTTYQVNPENGETTETTTYSYYTKYETKINGLDSQIKEYYTESFTPAAEPLNSEKMGLPTRAAVLLLFGSDCKCNTDEALAFSFLSNPGNFRTEDQFTLTPQVTSGGIDSTQMTVTVTPKLDADGFLYLTVTDSTGEYRLTLVFAAEHSGGTRATSGDVETIKDTVIWKLYRIEKGGENL